MNIPSVMSYRNTFNIDVVQNRLTICPTVRLAAGGLGMEPLLARLLDELLAECFGWVSVAVLLGLIAFLALGRALLRAKKFRVVIEYIAGDR
jgi:hypothetical protein